MSMRGSSGYLSEVDSVEVRGGREPVDGERALLHGLVLSTGLEHLQVDAHALDVVGRAVGRGVGGDAVDDGHRRWLALRRGEPVVSGDVCRRIRVESVVGEDGDGRVEQVGLAVDYTAE